MVKVDLSCMFCSIRQCLQTLSKSFRISHLSRENNGALLVLPTQKNTWQFSAALRSHRYGLEQNNTSVVRISTGVVLENPQSPLWPEASWKDSSIHCWNLHCCKQVGTHRHRSAKRKAKWANWNPFSKRVLKYNMSKRGLAMSRVKEQDVWAGLSGMELSGYPSWMRLIFPFDF